VTYSTLRNILATLSLTVSTQSNFVAHFLQAKCDFTPNGRFAFLSLPSPLGGLATYDDLRLIGERVVDFMLVLIELFLARCYGWGATSEYRFKIGDFFPMGAGWSKISGRRGHPDQTFIFSEN